MRRKKRSLPEEGFQMAPMIDMVFLLLVFFMCVSSAAIESFVPLDLAESETSKVPKDLSDRGTVSVDQEGKIYLGESVVNSEQLKKSIRELVSRKPDTRVVVRADQATEYKHIKKVLKDCAEAGAYEIVYATYEAG